MTIEQIKNRHSVLFILFFSYGMLAVLGLLIVKYFWGLYSFSSMIVEFMWVLGLSTALVCVLVKREASIQKREERYRSLFNHVDVGIWMMDLSQLLRELERLRENQMDNIRDYLTQNPAEQQRLIRTLKCLEVNRSARQFFALKNTTDINAVMYEYLSTRAGGLFVDILCAICQKKEFFRSEIIVEFGTQIKKVGDFSMPIPMSSDEASYVPMIVNDVTEAKATEDRLRRQKNEQKQIVDSMLDATITIDEHFTIQSFNPAACHLFGYDLEEIIGQNIHILMPKNFIPMHDEKVRHFLSTPGNRKQLGLDKEIYGLHKSGTTFPMRMQVAELPYTEGESRRLIGVCHDLSVEKEQERQLRHAQKMDALGKLTGGIAHDYNNMLGVILGFSELLQNKLRDEPKLNHYVDKIIHAGERGKKLTNQLMAFSKDKSVVKDVVNINTVLHEVRDIIEQTLTSRVILDYQLEDGLWLTELSRGELEDSIINMAINALHAMENGGLFLVYTKNIELSTSEASAIGGLAPGKYVLVEFIDSGHGMSEEVMAKIFDPFFSTKGKEGTGLGLSQVYRFVQRNHGLIKVFSDINIGTRFELYFPEVKSEQVELVKALPSAPVNFNSDKPVRILLVEDEEELQGLLEQLLIAEKFDVVCANHGAEALGILKRDKNFDLIVSDVIMPHVDGFELTSEIKKYCPNVKIQLISGQAETNSEPDVDKDTISNILYKPFTNQEFIGKVYSMCHGQCEIVRQSIQ